MNILIYGATEEQIPAEVRGISSHLFFMSYDPEKMMDTMDPLPSVILCFPDKGGMSALEIAQTLRMTYAETSIYFIAHEKKDFDKKKMLKNGFTQAFLLPWENSDFFRCLKEEAIYSSIPDLKNFVPIKVVDLQPGTVLDFSLKIYLPMNGKLLPFALAGNSISEEKLDKLNSHNTNTLFVHKDDVDKFHHYTAEMFRKLLKPNQMSETEKQEKLDSYVRELLSDMFIEDTRENTFGKSQSLLGQIKEVIKLLIVEDDQEVAKKINLLVNQEQSFYLHLSNVSSYAGLFAIVLGFEKPQNMALAGLLHDLGKINLPPEIAGLNEEELSPHFKEAYHKHPTYTLDLIRLKKLVVTEDVMKGILHHHEHMNGTGYPAGLEGHRISKEGRLIAIADCFDYLTSSRPGIKTLTPAEAMEKMIFDNTKDPGRTELDVEMLRKLNSFFLKG